MQTPGTPAASHVLTTTKMAMAHASVARTHARTHTHTHTHTQVLNDILHSVARAFFGCVCVCLCVCVCVCVSVSVYDLCERVCNPTNSHNPPTLAGWAAAALLLATSC